MVLQSDAIEEPFLVPQRTFQTRVLKEPFPSRVLQITYEGVSKNLKNDFFKGPFLVPRRTFQTKVL